MRTLSHSCPGRPQVPIPLPRMAANSSSQRILKLLAHDRLTWCSLLMMSHICSDNKLKGAMKLPTSRPSAAQHDTAHHIRWRDSMAQRPSLPSSGSVDILVARTRGSSLANLQGLQPQPVCTCVLPQLQSRTVPYTLACV